MPLRASSWAAKLAATGTKTNNSPEALVAKLQLRRNVLEQVRAPVLDCFAGAGEMWRGVWKNAPSYIGIDAQYYPDERLMFVADTHRVLRNIDLAPFGVFDLDAWGSPWEAAYIISARRRVKAGERLGFAITEGSGMGLRLGNLSMALSLLTGLAPKISGANRLQIDITDRAVAGLARRMNCKLLKRWEAGKSKGSPMLYLGLVFEGLAG